MADGNPVAGRITDRAKYKNGVQYEKYYCEIRISV